MLLICNVRSTSLVSLLQEMQYFSGATKQTVLWIHRRSLGNFFMQSLQKKTAFKIKVPPYDDALWKWYVFLTILKLCKTLWWKSDNYQSNEISLIIRDKYKVYWSSAEGSESEQQAVCENRMNSLTGRKCLIVSI